MDDLLAAAGRHGFPITYDELVECVETNDKRRYSFDETGDLIRANQGHSVEVDLQLEEREPPEVLYHGTVERFLPSILAEGLNKGRRHHVHLSKDVETARKVGARRGKPVILKVDAGRMHRDGHTFFLSANGVWLTDCRAARLPIKDVRGRLARAPVFRTSPSTRKTSSAMTCRPLVVGVQLVAEVLVPELRGDIDQRDPALPAVRRQPLVVVGPHGGATPRPPGGGTSTRSQAGR